MRWRFRNFKLSCILSYSASWSSIRFRSWNVEIYQIKITRFSSRNLLCTFLPCEHIVAEYARTWTLDALIVNLHFPVFVNCGRNNRGRCQHARRGELACRNLPRIRQGELAVWQNASEEFGDAPIDAGVENSRRRFCVILDGWTSKLATARNRGMPEWWQMKRSDGRREADALPGARCAHSASSPLPLPRARNGLRN